MNVSVLLRLLPQALAEGRVAGHAEIVDTGETALFQDANEMIAFIQSARGRDQDGDQTPDGAQTFEGQSPS
jgi:hypothetical protein